LDHARCLKLPVQNVDRNVKSRFSLRKANPFTAKAVTQRRKVLLINSLRSALIRPWRVLSNQRLTISKTVAKDKLEILYPKSVPICTSKRSEDPRSEAEIPECLYPEPNSKTLQFSNPPFKNLDSQSTP
jgi:hypothetical protein